MVATLIDHCVKLRDGGHYTISSGTPKHITIIQLLPASSGITLYICTSTHILFPPYLENLEFCHLLFQAWTLP